MRPEWSTCVKYVKQRGSGEGFMHIEVRCVCLIVAFTATLFSGSALGPVAHTHHSGPVGASGGLVSHFLIYVMY